MSCIRDFKFVIHIAFEMIPSVVAITSEENPSTKIATSKLNNT